jgi:hypothetical protein
LAIKRRCFLVDLDDVKRRLGEIREWNKGIGSYDMPTTVAARGHITHLLALIEAFLPVIKAAETKLKATWLRKDIPYENIQRLMMGAACDVIDAFNEIDEEYEEALEEDGNHGPE